MKLFSLLALGLAVGLCAHADSAVPAPTTTYSAIPTAPPGGAKETAGKKKKGKKKRRAPHGDINLAPVGGSGLPGSDRTEGPSGSSPPGTP